MNLTLVNIKKETKIKNEKEDHYFLLTFVSDKDKVQHRIDAEEFDEAEWHLWAKYSVNMPEPTDVLKSTIKRKGKQVFMDQYVDKPDT